MARNCTTRSLGRNPARCLDGRISFFPHQITRCGSHEGSGYCNPLPSSQRRGAAEINRSHLLGREAGGGILRIHDDDDFRVRAGCNQGKSAHAQAGDSYYAWRLLSENEVERRADHVERAVEAGLNISLNFAVTCRPSFESISKLPSESMPSGWPEIDPPGPAANTEAMAYVVEQVAR